MLQDLLEFLVQWDGHDSQLTSKKRFCNHQTSFRLFQNHIQNLLAAITSISLFYNLEKISKDIFLNYEIPDGRGDISKIKFKNRLINFVDESYNSNPLSLKTALINFANKKINRNTKHVLLGDMLELGNDSTKHHMYIGKMINKLNIDKVHIYGNYVKKTYEVVKKNKRGLILNDISKIKDLINKRINNNDYLMIKGSNSTGLFKQSQLLKLNKLNAL